MPTPESTPAPSADDDPMFYRNERGVLTFDVDLFGAALDHTQKELDDLRELAQHATEYTYPTDPTQFEEPLAAIAEHDQDAIALRVRRRKAGWMIECAWYTSWDAANQRFERPDAGTLYPTARDAMADLPAARTAHTAAVADYLAKRDRQLRGTAARKAAYGSA